MNSKKKIDQNFNFFLGARVIKTTTAVFLTLVLSHFRTGTPFYGVIAAILCIDQKKENSLRVGKNRIYGTLIGAAYGLIAIILIKYLNLEYDSFLAHGIIALFIIPIINTTLFLKKASISYISCVVFMSITVSRMNDPNPMIFVANRIIDTLIGVAVATIVNIIPPHYKRNHSTEE